MLGSDRRRFPLPTGAASGGGGGAPEAPGGGAKSLGLASLLGLLNMVVTYEEQRLRQPVEELNISLAPVSFG